MNNTQIRKAVTEDDSYCCMGRPSDISKSSGIRCLWEVTRNCNQKCLHCVTDSGSFVREEKELTTNEALQLIDQLKELPISTVAITGGEALVRKDIFKIIKSLSNNGIRTILLSNLTLLNERKAFLLSSNVSKVVTSIDGANPETHDTIRGVRGSFKKTLEAIKLLQKYNVEIEIITVACKINLSEIEDIVNLARTLNIPSILISKVFLVGRANKNKAKLALDRSSQRMLFEKIVNLRKRYKDIRIRTSMLVSSPPFGPCFAAEKVIGIDAEGYVHPCLLYRIGKRKENNIKNLSIKEIIKSKEFEKIRLQNSKWSCENKKCKYHESCKGGCRGLSINKYSFNHPSLICENFYGGKFR